jgi:drug/metabolite transporter (DMT)-like permease
MWFALAFGAALTQAGQFAVVKGRARRIRPLVLIFWTQAFGLAVWALYFAATGTAFHLPGTVWAPLGLSLALTGAMGYLLVRASAAGDISIVGPVLALSPIFAIVPDYLVSGTLPRGIGWAGILLSVAGTMFLGTEGGLSVDLGRLFRRADALAALGAAIVIGVLAAVDRRNATIAGVPSYLLAVHGAMTVVTGLLVAVRAADEFRATLQPATLGGMLGYAALSCAGTVLFVTAITLAPAAYVNAVRRTSSMFSVVLGRALFAERGFPARLASAALTTAGVACLLLAR